MTKNSWIMAWAVLLSSIVTEEENESVSLIALKIFIYLFLHQHGTTQLRGTQRLKPFPLCVWGGGHVSNFPTRLSNLSKNLRKMFLVGVAVRQSAEVLCDTVATW